MRGRLWAILVLWGVICPFAEAQFVEAPKREYRAVWIATIKGIDWPAQPATSAQGIEQQKQHFRELLDTLEQIHINTVFLQTRIRGDVIYPSKLEPFNAVFGGKEGHSPGYDPLAFAIEECHRRGIQLHAWIVAFPLGNVHYVQGLGKQALPVRQPDLCKKFKGSWYMDPAQPGTAAYLCRLVEEVLSQYDVDGIHLDYIRYPEQNQGYPDGADYRKARTRRSKEQWRRDNVTTVMRVLYNKVKELKPWVCVSAAPLGKYKDTSRYSSYGWNAYHTVNQAAQEWLEEGCVDALFPMLYYRDQHFFPFVADWSEHTYGRHVAPGIGVYQLRDDEKRWEREVVTRQLYNVRAQALSGVAFFRARHLCDNTKGVLDEMRLIYPTPALTPPLTWIKDNPPLPPTQLKADLTGQRIALSWEPTDSSCLYNVYADTHYPVDIQQAKNLRGVRLTECQFQEYLSARIPVSNYAVTAIDRYGNESDPAQWQNTLLPSVQLSPHLQRAKETSNE